MSGHRTPATTDTPPIPPAWPITMAVTLATIGLWITWLTG